MLKKYQLLLISLSGAVLLSLGWPANGFPGLLFIGFIPFLFLEDYISANPGRFGRLSVFNYTFVGFLAWNILTTWWIWNSTEVGAILAFVLNSLMMAIVFHVYHISKRAQASRQLYIILIFYWITYEYFTHNWEGNWSWLSLGNGFANYIKWIQWYEYTGIFGGSIWALIVNILLYRALMNLLERKSLKRLLLPLISAILLIIIPIIISINIFNNYKETEEPVDIVVVQPNMDPWTEQFNVPASDAVQVNLDLARQLLDDKVEYVVSPESAIQDRIWENYISEAVSLKKIHEFTREFPNLQYIIGASTYYEFQQGEPLTATARKFRNGTGYYDAFNTAICISAYDTLQLHHKSKLTPGVERMPFTKYLKPIERFAFNLGGTVGSLGMDPERTVFTRPQDNLKVAPVICYESVFGEYMAEYIHKGASLIFVITNDGWWGNSPGHKQHFTFSRLRAIETRRSIARSANTGISAFIDQRGQVFQATNYWESAVIRQTINANTEITTYVKYGDYLARLSVFVSAFLVLITFVRRIIKK